MMQLRSEPPAQVCGFFSPMHAASIELAVNLARASKWANAAELAEILYARWYAMPSGSFQHVEPTWPPVVGMLREGHGAAHQWREATVVKIGAAGVLVARDVAGQLRALPKGAYTHPDHSLDTGLMPHIGDKVLILPRSGSVVGEGWWRTWGGGWKPQIVSNDVTRVYLSPVIATLPRLAHVVTRMLEQKKVPWLIKAATTPTALARPDGFVLYLHDAVAEENIDYISGQLAELTTQQPGPPLTHMVKPGVSWARDPGDGRSFGESRCQMIATALDYLVHQNGGDLLSTPAALAEIAKFFKAKGISPQEPYLRTTQVV